MLRFRVNNPQYFSVGKTSTTTATTNLPIHSNALHGKKSSTKGCTVSFIIMWMMVGLCSLLFVVANKVNIHHTNERGGGMTPQSSSAPRSRLPIAFNGLIQRAKAQRTHCKDLGLEWSDKVQQGQSYETNGHTAHLSSFGFLLHLEQYLASQKSPDAEHKKDGSEWECVLPPESECHESQFTVIFMAHNPDRLAKMINQIRVFQQDFSGMVKEVVVVWNGPTKENLQQHPLGQQLLQHPLVRVEYPLDHGFPNDLFNRYHPRLAIQTKAILYYDDDGPFYSYHAIVGGFELWKRNANAQIGAMARKLDFSPRQLTEQETMISTLSTTGAGASPLPDRFFISHCPNDQIRYNYNEFAQFGAKMVLPSGSFLHSNYLSCLWHPLFQPLRTYIQQHPVHPDDGTVSMVIAQLSGRAPKVYSRRINTSNNEAVATGKMTRRLLQEWSPGRTRRMSNETSTMMPGQEELNVAFRDSQALNDRRRLMDGINWDAPGAHAQKMDWGKLRSDVANSLARYFGSVNSGSLGWCYGTEYQHGESCQPDQAKVGMIPWLNPDHTARKTCP